MCYVRYVLRCKDDSLYCGITNDLEARIEKHSTGKGAKYTKSRGPFELVMVDEFGGKSQALKAECEFKKLSKKKKEEIVAERSEYQKGIIKRYYENKEDIDSQKLGEIVSELYLATSDVNKKRLWKSAGTSLLSLVADKPAMKVRAEKIIADKDLVELAKIVGEIF
jgi:putative endonuclease